MARHSLLLQHLSCNFELRVKCMAQKKEVELKASPLIVESWDTRTRTKNDRTRICSVTITPYPNFIVATRSLIASAKVLIIFELTMFSRVFFAETSYFS